MTTTTGPGGAFGYQTRYDPAGNVIEMGGSYYTYDALGRLKAAHDAETGDNYEYQYDLASNRTEVRKNGEVVQNLSFTTADEIDTSANPEFAYDSAGRLISDTTASGEKRSYHWDGYGRLSGVDIYSPTTGHSENLRMSYDAAGRLSEKRHYIDLTWPLERLFYHYDGDRLVAEEDMTGTVREYLYAGGEAPTAMRARQAEGSYKNFFFVTNTHGDVVAVTDRDGNVVNRYAYGPWGEAARVSEQVHQPFRYAGYRYEDGFDLYYLRARWYDSGTGRFLSRDQFRGLRKVLPSLNKYAYTWGNAATLIDPSGYSPRRPQGARAPGTYPACSSGSSSGSTWDYLMGVVGPPCDFKTYISPSYDPDYKFTDAGWRMIKPSWAGDACSAPATETGPYWNFWDACGTHDYGYDLIRYGHRAGQVLVSKGDVDDLFFVDMSAHCEKRGFFTKNQCRTVAAAYYLAVRNNGSEPT